MKKSIKSQRERLLCFYDYKNQITNVLICDRVTLIPKKNTSKKYLNRLNIYDLFTPKSEFSHDRISRKHYTKRLSCVRFDIFFRSRIKIAIYRLIRAQARESKVIQEFVANLLETMPFSGRGSPNMEETGTTVTLMMAFLANRNAHYYTHRSFIRFIGRHFRNIGNIVAQKHTIHPAQYFPVLSRLSCFCSHTIDIVQARLHYPKRLT